MQMIISACTYVPLRMDRECDCRVLLDRENLSNISNEKWEKLLGEIPFFFSMD